MKKGIGKFDFVCIVFLPAKVNVSKYDKTNPQSE